MPVFGLNNGTVPIIAYNYGAGKPDRIIGTIKLAAVYATTIMLCGFAVFQLMPDKLLMIFSASDTMLSIGIPALGSSPSASCLRAAPSSVLPCSRHLDMEC